VTLRLASARRKVRTFLQQIIDLEAADFPHTDGKEALTAIKEVILIRDRSLERLPGTVAAHVVDDTCSNTTMTLARYTSVLGFILRSTNVRNAFEVHFPLKRLIQKTIAPDAKLIMSSEWNFVPFTYPMTLEMLEKFVFVGGPAPESENVLIVPLAGHEIGHSAWRQHKFEISTRPALLAAIDNAINTDPKKRESILFELKPHGHDLTWLRHTCLKYAQKQLEEIFCDMFALYVFGPSYLYAYEYFLAPGIPSRSNTYPASEDRVQYLKDGAAKLNLSYDNDLFARWLSSPPSSGTAGNILSFSDSAVREVYPNICDRAFGLLKQAAMPMCDEIAVSRVMHALGRGVPDGDGATLAEIVTAGWRYLRDKGGLSLDKEQPQLVMLNELMLKSVEVSEFKLRIGNA
jgi:hypothetical protein